MRYILFLMLIGIIGCVTTPTGLSTSGQEPTLLGARQIEVRTLDVPYDTAYQAAMQALFSLGYSISHTEKASGIITGCRMIDVQAAKQDAKNKAALSFIPYVGMATLLMPSIEPTSLQVTMLIQATDDTNQTQIRFKMLANGEPIWDPTTIDRLWVTTQREAMVESGAPSNNGTIKKED